MSMHDTEAIENFFPIGTKVRCESEMYPGKWDRGVVDSHRETRYGVSWAIRIRLEDKNPIIDGSLVDFDYRYLDIEDQRNSLVRKVR